jgi:hypothetical protein
MAKIPLPLDSMLEAVDPPHPPPVTAGSGPITKKSGGFKGLSSSLLTWGKQMDYMASSTMTGWRAVRARGEPPPGKSNGSKQTEKRMELTVKIVGKLLKVLAWAFLLVSWAYLTYFVGLFLSEKLMENVVAFAFLLRLAVAGISFLILYVKIDAYRLQQRSKSFRPRED